MDAYERSLKQQAERIKRELSKEGQKGSPPPKVEVTEEFIPSDVPSPIYGYARPKPKIVLPVEHSPETRDAYDSKMASTHSTTEEPIQESSTEPVSEPEWSKESNELISEEMEMEEKPILGEVSILDNGFSSVFMQSTDLSRSKKETVVEAHQDATPHTVLDIDESAEQIGSSLEQIAERLQTPSEQQEVPSATDLTSAVQVSFKADQPPVNVMMTPKDRMAMYRSRRLAQKNNNL
ncbi:MAG: hypothetical protein IJJ35_13520 [Exiguobacterium sp.]|uniref:hypothetical protein n=1 Tax=unclassified Exiguobacterium TaxID=2644629 RepID=UPI001BEB18F2|nr:MULTISPECIES: hypothetical protein [unclassified Exiguobacterium]MBQ6460590.1 hypothetical protein [Exiguobacterium sp.]